MTTDAHHFKVIKISQGHGPQPQPPQVEVQEGPCPGRRRISAGGPLIGYTARNCTLASLWGHLVSDPPEEGHLPQGCPILSSAAPFGSQSYEEGKYCACR